MKHRLLRSSTARGSSTRLSLVGPTKVKACKFFLFTEGSLKVENKIISQIVGISEGCDQNVNFITLPVNPFTICYHTFVIIM